MNAVPLTDGAPPTDPMSEARALAEVIEYGDPEERDAGIAAAVRAFRAICDPASVEALGRELFVAFWARQKGDDKPLWDEAAQAIRSMWISIAQDCLTHLARIAMEGGER